MLAGQPPLSDDLEGVDPRLTGAERADEIWRVRTRRRYAALTKDLNGLCRHWTGDCASPGEWDLSRLDVPCSELLEEVPEVRKAAFAAIEEVLGRYDTEEYFRELQDERANFRDAFEDEEQHGAAREVRHVIVSRLRGVEPSRSRVSSTGSTTPLWKVTGGTKDGGILVREDPSRRILGRLTTGSIVREVFLTKDKLHYQLLEGAGPPEGMVNLAVKVNGEEKAIVARISAPDSRSSIHKEVLVLGLMAVHIFSENRLRRLEYVLRSVCNQDVPQSEAQFLFSVSWSASTEQLEKRVQAILKELTLRSGVQMISVRQSDRHSQFQHVKAAFKLALAELSQRVPTEKAFGSAWVIFGDDDDIWHRRRVAEYVHAIRAHPMPDGVAAFVTMTRVNCSEDSSVRDEELPCTEEAVELFLRQGKGERQERLPQSLDWLERYAEEGCDAQITQALNLEYFDYCPRLRILAEFFERTPTSLLEHKYCDIHCTNFLASYFWKGREMGLEVSFFSPHSWMLFYSTPSTTDLQWEEAVEKVYEDTEALKIDVNNGHMSTNLEVKKSDEELAERSCQEFQEYDRRMTVPRLARYWAAFRNNVELQFMKRVCSTWDQRAVEVCVFLAINQSFFQFDQMLNCMRDQDKAEVAKRMMYYVGRGYAQALADSLGLTIFWVNHDIFLGRDVFYNMAGVDVPLLGLYATSKKAPHF